MDLEVIDDGLTWQEEVKVDLVIRAFGWFNEAAGSRAGHWSSWVRQGGRFWSWLFIGQKVIDLSGGMINDTNHGKWYILFSIRGIKWGSMACIDMAIKQDNAYNGPYDCRVCADLSISIDEVELVMAVELFWHAKYCVQFVFRFLESCGMNEENILMESMMAAKQAGKSGNDTIITGWCFIVKVNKGFAAGITYISFFRSSMNMGSWLHDQGGLHVG
jgi:hypothetical protein